MAEENKRKLYVLDLVVFLSLILFNCCTLVFNISLLPRVIHSVPAFFIVQSMVANLVCIIREKLWSDNHYLSLNINLEEESDEDELDIDDEEDERGSCEIDYVIGDVTHPLKAGDQDAIIVHCVGKY